MKKPSRVGSHAPAIRIGRLAQHIRPRHRLYNHEVDTDPLQRLQVAAQAAHKHFKLSEVEGRVTIPAHHPITIFHVGDIHWGSVYTNAKMWDEHRRAILKTPGCYVLFYHNLVDNAIPAKYPNNLLANFTPPNEQFKIMRRWLRELNEAGKILAVIEGDCHEGWSWDAAGLSAAELMYGFAGRRFPVLENGAILWLTVGRVQYCIGMWHKQGPFNSNFNPEHSLRQNRRLYHEGKTDIEVGAHNHIACASASWAGSRMSLKTVFFMRVGTYKGTEENSAIGHVGEWITDKFNVDRRGISGEPPGASNMLWPDRKLIDASLTFELGLEKQLRVNRGR